MKHVLILALFALTFSTASAQVRVAPTQLSTPQDTIQQLSIMFNNTVPPSQLLIEAGRYRTRAIESVLIGGAIGGVMMTVSDPEGSTNWQLLGAGVVTVSAIVGLIFEGISAGKERQAGEQLQRISISLGGISYHF